MKGISPIIASVLLIAFTVAVGGILSVWSTTLTTTQTQTVSNQTGGQVVCSPALIIDEAKVPSINNGTANITYRNAGSQGITSVKVWVRTTAGNINSTSVSAGLAAGESTVTSVSLTVYNMTSTADWIRVSGICANVVAVSAECTPTQKCWKIV